MIRAVVQPAGMVVPPGMMTGSAGGSDDRAAGLIGVGSQRIGARPAGNDRSNERGGNLGSRVTGDVNVTDVAVGGGDGSGRRAGRRAGPRQAELQPVALAPPSAAIPVMISVPCEQGTPPHMSGGRELTAT